jgi:trk system potassium uptake protein TrkA
VPTFTEESHVEHVVRSGFRETHPPRAPGRRATAFTAGSPVQDRTRSDPRRGALNRGVDAGTLKRVPLFADLDPAELQLVADSMHRRIFGAGETVTAEGGAGNGFFVVISGEAAVTVVGQPRGTVAPGEFFGEIALLQGCDRTATATATSDLHCYALTPLDFRAVVEGSPSLAWKLIHSMSERLS